MATPVGDGSTGGAAPGVGGDESSRSRGDGAGGRGSRVPTSRLGVTFSCLSKPKKAAARSPSVWATCLRWALPAALLGTSPTQPSRTRRVPRWLHQLAIAQLAAPHPASVATNPRHLEAIELGAVGPKYQH